MAGSPASTSPTKCCCCLQGSCTSPPWDRLPSNPRGVLPDESPCRLSDKSSGVHVAARHAMDAPPWGVFTEKGASVEPGPRAREALLPGAFHDAVTHMSDTIMHIHATIMEWPMLAWMSDGGDPFEASAVWQALSRLRVALEDAYLRTSRELGVTVQQAELLTAAGRPVAVGDLARLLRCDGSNVSRLVDRAAKRELISRRNDPDDARVTLIEVTPEGRRLAEAFAAALEGRLRGLLATWQRSRSRTAADLLNEIAAELDTSHSALRGHR